MSLKMAPGLLSFSPLEMIKKRLYVKVIVLMVLILTIWIGISVYIGLFMQTKQFYENAQRKIVLLTETIENSIVHSMLIGKHEDVRDLLFTIGSENDIRDLRIITEEGLILISAKINEEGEITKREHLEKIRYGEKQFVGLDLKNENISMIKSIIGKPPCYECHIHDMNILGILDVNMSIAWMKVPVMVIRTFMSIAAIFTIVLISISTYFIITHLVDRPIGKLMGAMHLVRAGDWSTRVEVDREDEIGQLGNAFNFMIKEINILHDDSLKKEKALVRAEEELKYKNQIEEKNRLLQKTLEALTTLNNIGKEINAVWDIDSLLESILRMSSKIVNAKVSIITVLNRETEEFEIRYVVNGGKEKTFWENSIHNKIVKYVYASERQLLLPNFIKDGPFGNDHGEYIPQTILYTPLLAKGKVIGIIGMIDKVDGGVFSEEDLDILTTISCEAAVALENFNLYKDLKKSYFDAIRALVNAIEAKDPYTYGHSERVTQLALEVGKFLNLTEKSLEIISHAGILHDVGKIGVSLNILHKTIDLTPEEVMVIREHSQIGSRIIDHIAFLKDVKDGIRHHHERYDGNGYPDGLGASDVTLETKILSVADAYDAMTSDRPYRKAKSPDTAIEELKKGAGSQFDPYVVDVFIKVWQQQISTNKENVFNLKVSSQKS